MSLLFKLTIVFTLITFIQAGVFDRTNLRNNTANLDEKLKELEKANKNDIEDEIIPENIKKRHRSIGNYSCIHCAPPDCTNSRIFHGCVQCYTTHIRDTDGTTHKSKGCTRNHQQTMLTCGTLSHDGSAFHAKNNRSAQYSFDCCKGNFCNQNTTFPELPPVPKTILPDEPEPESSEISILVIILITILVMFVISCIIACLVKIYFKKRKEKIANNPEFDAFIDNGIGLRVQKVGDSTLLEYQKDIEDGDMCITSGSGAGMRHLDPRSFAKDIRLIEQIGKGRFGVEVWRGDWKSTSVAVKCFTSRDEVSYKRETEIYANIPLLHHENILKYYGSDLWSSNGCSYNWIVTHYHPQGSLYDFLNRVQAVPVEVAYRIILGALNGLSHLHEEIHGKQKKPFIAHRDIKSKNILVKGNDASNMSAVVADFGLALTETEFNDENFKMTEENVRVGTKRYMSPEVLDLSIIKTSKFTSFLASDMYSFGLVIWEVLRKTQLDADPASADDFALPYHMDVGPDPSFEEMYKVVCVAQRRPDIPEKWYQNQFTHKISAKLKELWA